MSRFREILDAAAYRSDDERREVAMAAHRMMNSVSCRPSDAAASTVSEYLSDPDSFMAQRERDHEEDRRVRDNEQAVREAAVWATRAAVARGHDETV